MIMQVYLDLGRGIFRAVDIPIVMRMNMNLAVLFI